MDALARLATLALPSVWLYHRGRVRQNSVAVTVSWVQSVVEWWKKHEHRYRDYITPTDILADSAHMVRAVWRSGLYPLFCRTEHPRRTFCMINTSGRG